MVVIVAIFSAFVSKDAFDDSKGGAMTTKNFKTQLFHI